MNTIKNYFKLLKPTKSVYLLQVLVGVLLAKGGVEHSTFQYILFFFAYWIFYGSLYAINDIIDYPIDKLDVIRSKRLIASGVINLKNAKIYSYSLLIFSLLFFLSLNVHSFVVALILTFINVTYALYVKKIAYLAMFYLGFSSMLKVYIGYVFESHSYNAQLIYYILAATYFVSIGFGAFKLIREIDFNQIRDTVIGRYSKNPLKSIQFAILFILFGVWYLAKGFEKELTLILAIIYPVILFIYYNNKMNVRRDLNKLGAIVSQGYLIDFNTIYLNTLTKLTKAVDEFKDNIKLKDN